jgi:hypothetical protein
MRDRKLMAVYCRPHTGRDTASVDVSDEKKVWLFESTKEGEHHELDIFGEGELYRTSVSDQRSPIFGHSRFFVSALLRLIPCFPVN